MNKEAMYCGMKIEAVEASARFDNVAFSSEFYDGTALPLTATYTCPRCGEPIGFTKQNFEDRARRRVSNLSAAHQHEFDAWASQNGYAGNDFLDWSCPGCTLAVRVYAQTWVGGRHGDSGVDLITVIEAEQKV